MEVLRDLGFSRVSNPRDIIKEAKLQKLITSLELWDKMREDRNNTSHEYNIEKASEIYG